MYNMKWISRDLHAVTWDTTPLKSHRFATCSNRSASTYRRRPWTLCCGYWQPALTGTWSCSDSNKLFASQLQSYSHTHIPWIVFSVINLMSKNYKKNTNDTEMMSFPTFRVRCSPDFGQLILQSSWPSLPRPINNRVDLEVRWSVFVGHVSWKLHLFVSFFVYQDDVRFVDSW